MKYTINIKNLDCANCAEELREELENKLNIENVEVNFISQTVKLDIDESRLDECKEIINNFEEVEVTSCSVPGALNSKKLKIEGLDCANCAEELEELLNKIETVNASVDFMNMSVDLSYGSPEAYNKAVDAINSFEECKVVENEDVKKESPLSEHKKDLILLAVSFVLFLPAFIMEKCGVSGFLKVLTYILYGISYIVIAHPILINTVKNIKKGIIFDENFLMTIASVGAMVLGAINGGEGFSEGVAVMLLYSLGELLQSLAVGKSRNFISSLMDLKSESATVFKNDDWVIVKPEELKVGDIIMVKVGEKIPVDGVITKGDTSLDMKSLNGEAMPRDVKENDEVMSGSINLSKVIEMKVEKEYSDSAVAKILDLVENSSSKKSENEKFITKFAKYYTPVVCMLALIVALIVPTVISLVNGDFAYATYSSWIYKALNFLVISCPCALVISVPLAYFGGIGSCARKGILVKGSTCLDEIAKADIIAFDKTGTLTEGVFEVTNSSNEEVLKIASSLEKYSSHPIALAFKNIESGLDVKDVEEEAGKGLKGTLNNDTVYAGNAKLLDEYNISFEKIESTSTIIYVARNNEYLGYIEIDDKVKEDAKETIERLHDLGLNKAVMLSGDNVKRAVKIKDELGLDDCRAGLLPQEKLDEANKLKENGKLIYVGDGINDAPVMTVSDCAISMGTVGSDAAIEASDMVIVSDKLSLIADARKTAKKTRVIVFENIIGSLAIKLLIMILDLCWGIIVKGSNFPMFVSIIADVGVMLLAVVNSMRLMKK